MKALPLLLGTGDIRGGIILCCGGCPGYYGMFSSIPGLYPPDAISTTPCDTHTQQHTHTCWDNQKCLQTLPNVPWDGQSCPQMRTPALMLTVTRPGKQEAFVISISQMRRLRLKGNYTHGK